MKSLKIYFFSKAYHIICLNNSWPTTDFESDRKWPGAPGHQNRKFRWWNGAYADCIETILFKKLILQVTLTNRLALTSSLAVPSCSSSSNSFFRGLFWLLRLNHPCPASAESKKLHVSTRFKQGACSCLQEEQ